MKFFGCIIEIIGPRSGAYLGCPVQTSQFERSSDGNIRGISSVAFIVYTIISGKICIPIDSQKTEVISDLCFKSMICIVGTIVEVSRPTVKPIVGDGNAESADRIS